MHIETYTYINAHTQTYICMYTYTHIRTYTHTHTYTHKHIHIVHWHNMPWQKYETNCGILWFANVWYGFIILAELLRSAMCLALFCGFTLFTFVLLLLSLLGVCLGVLSPAAVNSVNCVNHSKSPDVFIFFLCVPMCSVHVSSAVFTSVQS